MAKLKGITRRHRIFAKEYAITGDKIKAFDKAYPNNNYSPASKSSRISELINHPPIVNEISKYDEIVQEKVVKKVSFTFEKSVKKLEYLLEEAEKSINEQGIKKANVDAFMDSVKELNRMHGYTGKTTTNNTELKADKAVVFVNSKLEG